MVLDASAALSWFFKDERDEIAVGMARAVTERGAIVPPLFRWEMQNAFISAVRRKRITTELAVANLEALDELGLVVDEPILRSPFGAGIALAHRFRISAYDAAYLELAMRRSLPLMSRDERLMGAAAELTILWSPPTPRS